MKILILSDSHGNVGAIMDALAKESPDMMLHLGDHDKDCAKAKVEYPEIQVRSVRGNCDISSFELDIDEFTIGGRRFFMTHGHLYGVKTEISPIISAAALRGADILLFGHTHIQYHDVVSVDGCIFDSPFDDMILRAAQKNRKGAGVFQRLAALAGGKKPTIPVAADVRAPAHKERLTVVNPGSIGLGRKTYAVIELNNGASSINFESIGD